MKEPWPDVSGQWPEGEGYDEGDSGARDEMAGGRKRTGRLKGSGASADGENREAAVTDPGFLRVIADACG